MEPQKTDQDWSILVQSGLFDKLRFEGPVLVLVQGPWGQKTGLDWTFKHYIQVGNMLNMATVKAAAIAPELSEMGWPEMAKEFAFRNLFVLKE